MIVSKQHKEKNIKTIMIQTISIGQRDPEIEPKLLPNFYECHTESRSTKGYYSHDHLPDPHDPHVTARVLRTSDISGSITYRVGPNNTMGSRLEKEKHSRFEQCSQNLRG